MAAEPQEEYEVAAWVNDPPRMPPMLQEILTKYSGISEDETISHIDTALHCNCEECQSEQKEDPKIGHYDSLTFSMMRHRLYYTHILPTMKKELGPPGDVPVYLELGVCYGHEMRALLYQGVNAGLVFGIDRETVHLQRGYRLFRDKEFFPTSQLTTANVLDAAEVADKMESLMGKVSVLCLVSVFHLWTWEEQVQVAKNILPLMRRGGVIVGCQRGSVEAVSRSTEDGGSILHHDSATWKEMWMNHVTENGVITDPKASTKGERLGVYSELVEANPDEMPARLNIFKRYGDPNSPWYIEKDFRWMRFEVWVGRDPPFCPAGDAQRLRQSRQLSGHTRREGPQPSGQAWGTMCKTVPITRAGVTAVGERGEGPHALGYSDEQVDATAA